VLDYGLRSNAPLRREDLGVRRVLVWGVFCVAVSAAAGWTAATLSASTSPNRQTSHTTSLRLPSRDLYPELVTSSGLLQLTVTTGPTSNGCAVFEVETSRLRLGEAEPYSCGLPIPESDDAVNAVTIDPWSNDTTVHIVRRDSRTGRLVTGPAVMHYQEASDTSPVQTFGDGSLWVYDTATSRGGLLLRVSGSTGRVENAIRVPGDPDRPMLVTNDDGLWMTTQVNGGSSSCGNDVALYHVVPGSNVASVHCLSGGPNSFWIVASGQVVWVAVQHPEPHGLGALLYQLSGSTAHIVEERNVSDDVWQAVVAGPGGELFALVSPNTNDFGVGCPPPRLIAELPGSDTVIPVGQLPLNAGSTYSCEVLGASEQLATLDGTIYAVAGGRLWAIGT
jgi:hypothetical protein